MMGWVGVFYVYLTSNHTPGAEHPSIHRRALHHRSEDPKNARDLQRKLARVLVGNKRAAQRAYQTARRHRRRDAALCIADGVVKVVLVRARAQDAAHGADVEAKERSACELCASQRPAVSHQFLLLASTGWGMGVQMMAYLGQRTRI